MDEESVALWKDYDVVLGCEQDKRVDLSAWDPCPMIEAVHSQGSRPNFVDMACPILLVHVL